MSYIIDFRVRPPYKSFLGSGIFRCWDFQSPETMTAIQMGRNPIPSVREGSMDMFGFVVQKLFAMQCQMHV